MAAVCVSPSSVTVGPLVVVVARSVRPIVSDYLRHSSVRTPLNPFLDEETGADRGKQIPPNFHPLSSVEIQSMQQKQRRLSNFENACSSIEPLRHFDSSKLLVY